MAAKEKNSSLPGMMLALMVLVNAVILKNSFIDESPDYRPLLISLPLLLVAAIHSFGNRHTGN